MNICLSLFKIGSGWAIFVYKPVRLFSFFSVFDLDRIIGYFIAAKYKVAWPGDAVATVAEGVDLAAASSDGAGATGGEA